MRHEVVYAIVQFRPYRETEEFANVGVVMCAPKAGFFDYRVERIAFSRVTKFFNELDFRLPRTATNFVVDELQRVKEMTQRIGEPESVLRLFQQATKAKEGLIYFSQAKVALVDSDLGQYLEQLYQHYVHHSFAKQPSATEQLEGAMRALLEQHNLRKYYQQRSLEDEMGLVKARVPFTHQRDDNTLKAIRPLSLASSTPNKIVEDAEQWAARFKRLFKAGILIPENVIMPIEPPQDNNDKTILFAVNMANGILKNNKVTTMPANDEDRILTFASQL